MLSCEPVSTAAKKAEAKRKMSSIWRRSASADLSIPQQEVHLRPDAHSALCHLDLVWRLSRVGWVGSRWTETEK